MKNGKQFGLGLVLLMAATSTMAAPMGTPKEAKQLSQDAIKAVQSLGKEKAFSQFSDPKGEYQKKDLYVFCLNLEGKVLSHAVKPELVGKSLIGFNKYGDKPFEKMVKVAATQKEGWVDYKWPHPESGNIQEKQSYIISEGADMFCGVGAYK